MIDMLINKIAIEKKALEERDNMTSYGIKNIFSFIIQKDILLIRYPFGKDKLLGFSTIYEGKKVIVSNSSEILSREIYTVAHELGHIIFDLSDDSNGIKIDTTDEVSELGICEERAFHFANCFLMPEEELRRFIRHELKKYPQDLNAFDIVRMQLEFQVSYAALIVRLFDIGILNSSQKSNLFDKRDSLTSRVLFQKLDADQKLLKPAEVTEVPPNYLEYVTSNYDNNYIPYTSLEKALGLINMDASAFKITTACKDEELDIDVIFKEYKNERIC